MDYLKILFILTSILGVILICDITIATIKANIVMEQKLIRIMTIIFLTLFLWSILRFLKRYSSVNMYDYMIIFFNLGLFVVGHLASRYR